MKPKYQLLFVLLTLVLVTLACGQIDIGIEDQSQNQPDEVDDQLNDNAIDTRTEQPKPSPTPVLDSQYWRKVEDPRTGLRFAVPCFWVANIPTLQQDITQLGSFSVANFSEEFALSLGPKRAEAIWEIGGLKFDLGYHKMSDFGLDSNASIDQLAYAIVNPDQEHGIDALTQVIVDGKTGVQVDTWSTYGKGRFYLLPFTGDLYILFGPGPEGAGNHPDIQAILNSLVLSPDGILDMPTIQPSDPPQGFATSCMPVTGSTSAPTTESEPPITLMECNTVTEDDALLWTVCNVRDSFLSRNTQPLLGPMTDPFMIAYWQSEGTTRSREEALNEIIQVHLAETPGGETFTTDRSQFPPLFGQPPENMFGPNDKPAAIVYSEGWGTDGQGAALLYFKESSVGRYVFYAMVIAQEHFDK